MTDSIVQEITVAEWAVRQTALAARCTPYHSAAWGTAVASQSRGTFRVFQVRHGGKAFFLPVIVGGDLAPGAFVSGAIGYGGSISCDEDKQPLPTDHLRCADAVAKYLQLPCYRMTTPPQRAAEGNRQTQVVCLPQAPLGLEAHVSGNVRTACRRARSSGLVTGSLAAHHAQEATELIAQTQAVVQASYRTGERFISTLLRGPSQYFWGTGVWAGKRLVSVGIFARLGGSAAYIFTGWDRAVARLNPNPLMLWTALENAMEVGVSHMDLGYSHQPEIFAAKRRWNTQDANFYVIEGPSLSCGHQGAPVPLCSKGY